MVVSNALINLRMPVFLLLLNHDETFIQPVVIADMSGTVMEPALSGKKLSEGLFYLAGGGQQSTGGQFW